MIDIHTHILPGVDDGAQDLQESLAMLRGLEKNGVKAVFLTPHFAAKRGYSLSKETLLKRYNLVREAALAMNLSIELYFGAEVDYEQNFFEIIKKAPTLNESKYILLDLGSHKEDLTELIYECNLRNIKVIIAHPERYFQLSFDTLRSLKKYGALFQVSAPHLIGYGHKEVQAKAKRLLKEDMIDFIASDIHHPLSPLDIMADCYSYVLKKKGEKITKAIFKENARKYLINKT